jgi:hypothetical protein
MSSSSLPLKFSIAIDRLVVLYTQKLPPLRYCFTYVPDVNRHLTTLRILAVQQRSLSRSTVPLAWVEE